MGHITHAAPSATHTCTYRQTDRQTDGRTHLWSYLEMSSEGSCTMALEALPALSASSTNRIGTSSCSTTASLSLLALIALLTNKAQNCRQYSTTPCDLGCTAWSAEGSMSRVGGTREEPWPAGMSTVCSWKTQALNLGAKSKACKACKAYEVL